MKRHLGGVFLYPQFVYQLKIILEKINYYHLILIINSIFI